MQPATNTTQNTSKINQKNGPTPQKKSKQRKKNLKKKDENKINENKIKIIKKTIASSNFDRT